MCLHPVRQALLGVLAVEDILAVNFLKSLTANNQSLPMIVYRLNLKSCMVDDFFVSFSDDCLEDVYFAFEMMIEHATRD